MRCVCLGVFVCAFCSTHELVIGAATQHAAHGAMPSRRDHAACSRIPFPAGACPRTQVEQEEEMITNTLQKKLEKVRPAAAAAGGGGGDCRRPPAPRIHGRLRHARSTQ